MTFIAAAALPATSTAAPAIPDPDYGPGPAVVAPGVMNQAFDSLQDGDSTLVLGTDGTRIVIAAVGSDGDHDPGFGSAGVRALELPAGTVLDGELSAGSLARSPLGGYVGVVSDGSSSHLFRLTDAGDVDEAYGDLGWVAVPASRRSIVAVDATGRAITMSYGEVSDPAHPEYDNGLVIRRFEPDGSADGSFADAGVFAVGTQFTIPNQVGGQVVHPKDVVVHPSGDVTFASSLHPVSSARSEWWLLRLDNAGEELAEVKMFNASNQGPSSFLHRAVAGPGESTLVGGAVAAPPVDGRFRGWNQIVTRLDESLTPDPGFGDGGFRVTDADAGTRVGQTSAGDMYTESSRAGFIARGDSGRIYSARAIDYFSRLVIDRFGADGQADPGYTAVYDQPAGDLGHLVDLTTGPDETPIALFAIGPDGDSSPAPTTRVELVRFVESREGTPPGSPRFRSRVLRRKAPASTRRLVRRGVAIRAYCSRACIASVQLRVPRRVAKAANVFSPVARYSRRLRAGVHWFRVPLDVAVRRVLRANPAPLRGIRARVRFKPAC